MRILTLLEKQKNPTPKTPIKKNLFLGGFIYNREGGGEGVFINRGKRLIYGELASLWGLVAYSDSTISLSPSLFAELRIILH